MPIYEYECVKCGHQTEVWQKVTERAAPKCEACKGKMRKLISHSAFHLKGTGWYVTDYASNRSSEGKKPTGGDKEPATKEGAKDSADKPKKETAPSSTKSD